jgi:hypothetical protein
LERLTNAGERDILKEMSDQGTGRKKALWLASGCLFLALSAPAGGPFPQNEPPKKAVSDYMNAIIQRNTKPLGLKDNPILTRLNKQPRISWAVRVVARHILD